MRNYDRTNTTNSVALSVHNGGTVLAVVSLGDPGGLEGAEGSESGGTLPDGVLTVGGGNDSNLGTGWELGSDLLLESLGETLVHGGTTGEDKVLAEVLTHIDVGGLDGGIAEHVEGLARLTVELWLEEELWALNTHGGGNGDHTSVGEGELHVLLGGVLALFHFLLVLLGNDGSLLLDVLDDFELSGGGEGLTSAEEELLHPVGEDTAGNLHLLNGVRDAVTLVDWNSVGDTITSVANKTGGSTSSVEGHDGLEGNIGTLDLEGLEHDLDHALSVLLGVTWGLSEEDTDALLWGDTELVVEGVVPDLLHILPGLDDTGGDGVLKIEDTSLLLGLLTDELGLVGGTLHGVGVLWTTNNGWEDGSWGLLTGVTGLDHTGTIIDNHGLTVCWCFVCHLKDIVL